ncbi:MAG TPA: ATP-binding protein [Methylomirabilota bacterium]|nr:ATP-binding protein [Methylomirabilota bacterium]
MGFAPYGIPVVAVAVAALTRMALAPLWGPRLPFFTFFPAVMVAAWCRGFRAGILATALSVIVVDRLWLDSVFASPGHDIGELVAAALFVVMGIAISAACEGAQRDRRRLEATAAAERRLLQERVALLECTAQGLFGVDRDGRCTFINRACAGMLGWRPDEVLGRDMHTLLHPRRPDGRPCPRAECPIFSAVEQGAAAFVADDVVERRDGTSFPAEYAAQPLVVDGRLVGSIIALSDLSQRRSTEAEIGRLLAAERAARADAEAANRAKDEFLAVLSHELRTPLTAMLGWIALLRPGRLSAERTRYALEVIERNARMQAQLINDLLDISRIVAGKMELDRLAVDLAGVVARVVESAQREAEAKRIRVTTQVDAAAGPVLGDVTRLEQVVGNILANALKFTPVEGHVQVTLDRHEGRARLRVSDSGPGIGPDVLPHVFERFRQAESSSRRRHEGLGLGLAIVRHLVETHDGVVRADNDPDGGATVTVELPLLAMARRTETPAVAEAAEPAGAARIEGLTVLLVEDHTDSRETITLTLESCGAEVIAVPAVADALGVLRARTVDVLVSDLGMPGADGFDLIRRVRWQEGRDGRPRLPAIALTAYASAEDRERALAAGYDGHIAKPVDADDLCGALMRLVPKSRV